MHSEYMTKNMEMFEIIATFSQLIWLIMVNGCAQAQRIEKQIYQKV